MMEKSTSDVKDLALPLNFSQVYKSQKRFFTPNFILITITYILTIAKVFILKEYLHWLSEENSQNTEKGWYLIAILIGVLLLNIYLKSRAKLCVSRGTSAMEASIYKILIKKLTNSSKKA